MGATGDIIWRWQDPSTVELYNEPPPPEPPPEPEPQTAPDQYTGVAAPDQEREIMKQMMQAQPEDPHERANQATPQQKREWRKQLRMFDRYLKKGGTDIEQGIQELLDSGAMWYEGPESYTSVPVRNKATRERLVTAADAWQDRAAAGQLADDNPILQAYREAIKVGGQMTDEEFTRALGVAGGIQNP